MFVNVVSCVACLSIMCYTTSNVRMHMLLFFLWSFKNCLIFLEPRICLYILWKNWPYQSAYFLYCESTIHHAIPTQKRAIQKTCFYNLPCGESPISWCAFQCQEMIIIEHEVDVWRVMFPSMMVVGNILHMLHFEVYLNLNDI
jgi:hypothetical protein